ncbi:MAG: hypothetical protein CL843_18955 [Crocinitomicaceae bacterium]|nr:hypothetical protein [Crocinitomicaceae bacterium]|tara:strand:+ start:14158 stop:15051 length:894 start_codon:yes stop_codon:yes gene_type:complete
MVQDYTIADIIQFRNINWQKSAQFFYLEEIPTIHENAYFQPNYYSYGFVDSGTLIIEVDHKEHIIQGQSILIYRPGQVIRIKHIEPNTKGAFVLFTHQFLTHSVDNIFSLYKHSFLSQDYSSNIKLTAPDFIRFKNIFLDIFNILHKAPISTWEHIARSLSSALVLETNELLKTYSHSKTTSKQASSIEMVSEFRALVNENYKHNRKLDYYASQLNISTGYLHKVVKQLIGESPGEVIYNQLENDAKSQLSYSNKTVSEIAYDLGFHDLHHFSKFFKKRTGMSPNTYKLGIQNIHFN